MNYAVARRHALAMLRRRLARGGSRQQIEQTTFEGAAGGDAAPGYLMSAGRLSFPGVLRHEAAQCTFRLRDLLEEIEQRSTQRSLFA